MRRVALATELVLALACSSSSPSTSDASTTDASVDTTSLDAPPEGSTFPCGDASASPTQSFSLSSWPAFTAVTATDLTSGVDVMTTSVPGAPAGVLVTRDGGWVLAAVASTPGQLAVLSRASTKLTYAHGISMATGETPFGIAQSSDSKTVAMTLSDEVALFDLAKVESNDPTALLGTVATQSAMKVTIDVTFSLDGLFAFAALEYDHSVAVIDVTNLSYVGAIPIAGDAVTGVVVSPDGTRLYVTCEESDEFAAANPSPATDQIVGSLTVADVATAETSPATSVLGRVFVGRAPVRAAISPDGSTIWVTLRGSNAVAALATAYLPTGACDPLLSTTAVGPAPVGLAFVTGGTGLAIANSNRFLEPTQNQTVMFVDVASALASSGAAVIGQASVGAFPREIDDDATALFVSNYDASSISGMSPPTF